MILIDHIKKIYNGINIEENKKKGWIILSIAVM